MKGEWTHYKAADPQPSSRAKPFRDKRIRVKGLSAACKKKKHSNCSVLTCHCICHYNFNRRK